MSGKDPYARKLVTTDYYAEKNGLTARVVAVLRGSLDNRSLELIPQPSRVVKQGEIHELIVTDEDAGPGKTVQKIAYVAFVEFLNGGVLLYEDPILVGDHTLGTLAGYDMAHFPNHMNIVIRGKRESGEEIGLRVGTPLIFAEKRSAVAVSNINPKQQN